MTAQISAFRQEGLERVAQQCLAPLDSSTQADGLPCPRGLPFWAGAIKITSQLISPSSHHHRLQKTFQEHIKNVVIHLGHAVFSLLSFPERQLRAEGIVCGFPKPLIRFL